MFAVALGLEGAVDLGVFAAFCFMVALDFAYALTLGVALLAIANALDYVASNLGPFGFLFSSPAGWITSLNNTMHSSIGTGLQATEWAWHKMTHYMASTLAGIGEAMAYVASETLRGFDTLVRYTIPHLIAAAVAPVERVARSAADAALSAGRAVPAEVTKVIRITKVLPREVIVEVPKIAKAATQSVATAGAVAGALVFPRLGQIERDLQAAKANVAKLSKWLTVAGAAALVAAGIARLGLGSQNCSNVKKLNKGLCGINPAWIEDLLLGAVSIFGTLSLVKLAEDYQQIIASVSGDVSHFWRADVAGLGADRSLGAPGGGLASHNGGDRALGSAT